MTPESGNNDEVSLSIDLDDSPEPETQAVEALEAEFQEAVVALQEDGEREPVSQFCEPEAPLPAESPFQEKREHQRYLVNWKVAVVNAKGGKDHVFHGRARDISLGGLCFLSEHNLTFGNPVRVLIAVPPHLPNRPPHVLEVRSKLAYTVLEQGGRLFRIGITFLEFEGEARHFLEKRLAERQAVF